MAEGLSEAAWAAFTKKQKLALDDGALVKALAKFDKTDAAKAEPRLAALDDVVEQIKKQVTALAKKKKELGDKPFGEAKDKLYGLLDRAETLQGETRSAIAAAEGGEEGDSPALLTTKMLPLIRELRKGEARMHAMICTAGKNTAVLIMRRAISPARRKLLAEAVDAAGGAKYYAAECLLEEGALTFILQGAAGGMAKRLRAALLEQSGLRLKVRVRGEDGALDQDGEDEAEASAIPPAPPLPGQAAEAAAGMAPAPPSPEQAALAQRLADMQSRVDEAVAAKHPEAAKLTALLGFAQQKAAQPGDAGAAAKSLDMLDKLLLAPARREAPAQADPVAAFTARLGALMPAVKAAMAAGGPQAADLKLKVSEAGALARARNTEAAGRLLDEVEALLAGPKPFSIVALQKSRLEWDGLRKNVQSQLQQLEAAIVAAVRAHNADDTSQDEYDEAELSGAVRKLYGLLDRLDERLLDKLDDALNAASEEDRRARHAEAAALVKEYQAFVAGDPLVAAIDDNGFTPTTIRPAIVGTLEALAAQF